MATVTSALPDTELDDIRQSLRFPLEQNPAYDARIKFEIFKANTVDLQANKKLQEGSVYSRGGITNRPIIEDDETEERGGITNRPIGAYETYNQIAAAAIAENDTEIAEINKSLFRGFSYDRDESRGHIDLFFPLALIFNDNINYNDANLNFLGAASINALQNSSSILGAGASAIQESFKTLFDFARSDVGDQAAALGVSRLASKIAPEGLRNALNLSLGIRVNPNTRTLFTGVGIRQFTFQFKFIPTSQKESEEVERIIRVFREEAYPDVFDANSDLPFGYKFPNVFKISFKHKGQTANMPKLEFCYLRQVQHVYNPTGPNFHRDGRPNEIDVTLLFSEIRALNKKDIRRGA